MNRVITSLLVAASFIVWEQSARASAREAGEDVDKAAADVKREAEKVGSDVSEGTKKVGQDVKRPFTRDQHTVQGTLGSTRGAKITVRDASGGEVVLKTDAETRVTKNGEVEDLDDLEEGSPVRASYVVKGDDRIARDVQVTDEERD